MISVLTVCRFIKFEAWDTFNLVVGIKGLRIALCGPIIDVRSQIFILSEFNFLGFAL